MLQTSVVRGFIRLAVLALVASHAWPQAPAPVEYYRLAPGFIAETKNAAGWAVGTGFATPNPWGAYTAYLLSTNRKGQRSWRIENYLPMPARGVAQGSTMYLLEGSERALLIDTAQDTKDVIGKDDLKTVVRHLLSHANGGGPKDHAVDFVVAITHSHGDHTGKNAQMSDRRIYYPEGDWPASAPPNYVPIREGGGKTTHGDAVAEIELGGRTISAVDLHAHTRGSTGYLDRENRMIATGDAVGSAFVWAFFAPLSEYAGSVHHLQNVLDPLDHMAVLPAHFYQIASGDRGRPPLNGRPLDRQYVDDQVAAADGALSGRVISEPYSYSRDVVAARVGSAQVCYSLARVAPESARVAEYRAVMIPGPSWAAQPEIDPRYQKLSNIKTRFYLIRDRAGNSLYLIAGSRRAALVGSGSGAPGIAAFAKRLAGDLPLDVIVTSDDAGQVGGLPEFSDNLVYLPPGAPVSRAGLRNVRTAAAGDEVALGEDSAGRPAVLRVIPLQGHSRYGITLLDVNDRVLLSGDALGTQGSDPGLVLNSTLSDFARQFAAWRTQTDGTFDIVFTAHNFQWHTDRAWVDRIQTVIETGTGESHAPFADSASMPGRKLIKSAGPADVAASIVLAEQAER